MIKHPEFCASHKAYFWLTFEAKLHAEMGASGCKKCQEREPKEAAIDSRRQAGQSRGSPSFSGSRNYWLQKVPAKSARKGRFPDPKSGWPVIQHPECCAFFKAGSLPFLKHRPLRLEVGFTGSERAKNGCPKRSYSEPEIWLPSYVTQRPDFPPNSKGALLA